jgi:uncharacterized membrane protein
MMENARPGLDRPDSLWVQRITRWLTRFIHFFSVHWIWIISGAIGGFYVVLPVLAPWLMVRGHDSWANILYMIYRPLCHQLPERSFFLFGPQYVYTLEELSRAAGGLVPHRWVGNAEIGFKTAVCQRDLAIYGVMTLAGFLFWPLRRTLKPLPVRWFLAMLVPMAVDGGGQLIGLWTSTPWSRLITGGLFGLAAVLLAFPYLESGLREVRADAATVLAEASTPSTEAS